MTRNDLFKLLDSKGIDYQVTEHKAVFTVDEMLAAGLPYPELVAKNLFIRDDKKRNYYLLTAKEDRAIDLKAFQEQFHTRRLSFASENDLMAILQLAKGSVTPFGLLNDEERRVHFFLDQSFAHGIIGIHPMENTATVWMSGEVLTELVREHGNQITVF